MYENANTCLPKCIKCKLSVCGFSIATAFTSGLTVLILGLMATYLNIGTPYVTLLGSVYKGYAATYAGSFVGAGWAFAVGLLCGFFFSCIYNLCIRKCCCKSCKHCNKDEVHAKI